MNRTIRGVIALTSSLVLLLGVGATASHAAIVKNGNFETGNLSGWQQSSTGGVWKAIQDGDQACSDPVPPPIGGTFSAITDQGDPGRQILYQDVDLPDARRLRMRIKVAYLAFPEPLFTPDSGTLSTGESNQQVRIDVMKSGSPLTSVADRHIIKTMFASETGDAPFFGPVTRAANLSMYRGKEVRIRVAVVAVAGCLIVGVDNVKITRS